MNTIDSIFPPSVEGSDADDTADLPELHEDPFQLFERGRAAVEARAKRSSEQQLPSEQPATSDLQDEQQSRAERSSSLVNKPSPQGKQSSSL